MMATFAVIVETAVSTLKLCNKCYKCCEAVKKDKEDEDDSGSEEESKEGSDSEEKPKAKSKNKTAKTKKKRSAEYAAVKQKEPTTTQPLPATVQNHFNPTFTIINSPYPSTVNLPGLPGVQVEQSGQAASGALTNEPSIVEWVPSSIETAGELVERAVIGGYDIDGSDLWIIRSRFMGEVIPGKLNHQHSLGFAAHKKDESYAEKNVEVFEVCCVAPEARERITWIKCSDGNVPKNAIVGGRKSSGEKLYIGRQLQNDENHKDRKSLCPGLIQPSHGVLYVTYDYKVYAHKFYEVMCIE